jgi:hypothetical protein
MIVAADRAPRRRELVRSGLVARWEVPAGQPDGTEGIYLLHLESRAAVRVTLDRDYSALSFWPADTR